MPINPSAEGMGMELVVNQTAIQDHVAPLLPTPNVAIFRFMLPAGEPTS
jgi:hypothetical protein